jgi:hypothetical protein
MSAHRRRSLVKTRRRCTAAGTLTSGLLVASLLLAACGGGSAGSGGGPSTTPTARPSSPATIRIVAPADGAVVHGPTVRVRVALTGARIVDATTTHITPTTGHLHLYLDGKIISMNYQLSQTIPDVPAGQHVLRVEFVAADHLPFDPRIITGVAFEVKG